MEHQSVASTRVQLSLQKPGEARNDAFLAPSEGVRPCPHLGPRTVRQSKSVARATQGVVRCWDSPRRFRQGSPLPLPTPVLQMKNPRLGEGKGLPKGHTAGIHPTLLTGVSDPFHHVAWQPVVCDLGWGQMSLSLRVKSAKVLPLEAEPAHGTHSSQP